MKKVILKLVCLSLILTTFSSCSKKEKEEDNSEEINNTVTLDNVGLSYTTPQSWEEYQKTNIYPLTQRGENTFAEITYLYLTTSQLEALDAGEELISQTGEAICQIVIAEKDIFEESSLSSQSSAFEKSELVSEEGNFGYYFLSGSKTAKDNLEREDLEVYKKLLLASSELKDSITTKEFDPSLLDEQVNFFNQYLTFETESMDNIPVASTVFGDADITILNFGATYAYPDFNEIEVLQSLHTLTKDIAGTKINLIYAVVDTPEEGAEKIVKAELKSAKADFLTIKMDEYLANWVVKNLEGIPSTVFVDNTGKIIGEIVKGAKTSKEYMTELEKRIEQSSK